MNESQSEAPYWLMFAAATVTVILAAAIRWSLAHPYGIHWDEASYLNEALIDAQRLRNGMLLKFGGRILLRSWGHPPAYRLLAGPFLALFGVGTTTARLVSLACYGLSSWYVYLSTRLVGSRIAGAFAVLVFCLSPEVIAASIFFGTDAPLYLATSAMLYYLLKSWSDPLEHVWDWVGLGLAVGLGFLAKTSFFMIAPPALISWFAISRWRKFGTPGLAVPIKAGILALLVAAPWWLLNIKGAIAYGQYARGFVRNSLGTPSVATWMRWLNTVIQSLLGHGVSIVIGLVLIAFLARFISGREAFLSPLQKSVLAVCACAGLPIILAQLSGTNHLLRHISPAMIPLAITVGVLADQTFWTINAAASLIPGILFCTQLFLIANPVMFPNKEAVEIGFVNGALPWRAMARFDQWNWSPVREIGKNCDLESPRIAYLGGGREFDPPAIAYPWVAAAASNHLDTFPIPDALWLWRYEEGPLDWQKVMNSAAESDMVVTTPRYLGEVENKEDKDNQYDSEFAQRLSRDPRFQGPILFQVGRFEPVEVAVFPRRSLVCHDISRESTDTSSSQH